MNQKFTRTLGMLALTAVLSPLTSCNKDLDQVPSYSANAEVVYASAASAEQVLARLYATFAVSGQTGPAGSPDISGIDEGFSNYLRQYWQIQEVTTDEAVIGWNDGNLPFLNTLQWNADNEFVRATYDRIYYEIALCNEFMRQTTDTKMSSRGVSEGDASLIRRYRAEARLLRALCYMHATDLFGGGPFADETGELGTNPPYHTRLENYNYVEQELKALSASKILLAPRSVYGRGDKALCWTLLAKLYLNAKVYTKTDTNPMGVDKSALASVYADSVLNAGYSLAPVYANLFKADNDRTSRSEIIFPIIFDGKSTKTYGGMTYLIHAPVGRGVTPSSAGINGGWSGLRAKPQLTAIINSSAGTDTRKALVYARGQNPNVDTLGVFSSGPLITKFRNVTSTGNAGSDTEGNFPDTDFPMFRLADVMLIKAEALARSGGSLGTALSLVNSVRQRAGADALPSFSANPLDDIFNERTREMFWEGQRRTDLIRFDKYTSGYNWPFKGGPKAGMDVAPTRALFPLPTTDIVANPNLVGHQNPGY